MLRCKINQPDWNRVYSLAVTSPTETIGGQLSSWPSEIDLSALGVTDDKQRLYIISAGNN